MVEQGESGTEPVTRLDHQADLIRQEHRLYYILSNWWTYRNYGGDPRQHAARRALIWRVVVSLLPGTVVAGVSLTAIAAVWLAIEANGLFGKQNITLKEQSDTLVQQNKRLGAQNQLVGEQRDLLVQQNALTVADRQRGFQRNRVS